MEVMTTDPTVVTIEPLPNARAIGSGPVVAEPDKVRNGQAETM
jgi:hypothetical protein